MVLRKTNKILNLFNFCHFPQCFVMGKYNKGNYYTDMNNTYVTRGLLFSLTFNEHTNEHIKLEITMTVKLLQWVKFKKEK